MKRVRAVLAVAAVSLVCFLHAACYDETALENAHALYDVDLIKGSSGVFSAEGMELDRVATRAEMAVTVTRMLGKEAKAVYQHNSHPFTDVPDWAGDCVGWLYENYLVNGVSETAFGAYENASLTQFCAMMLRVLGYSDVKGDFSYEQAVPFALSVGLADESMLQKQLLERGDMVKICYRSLFLPLKRARRLLYEKLEDEKVLTQDDIERRKEDVEVVRFSRKGERTAQKREYHNSLGASEFQDIFRRIGYKEDKYIVERSRDIVRFSADYQKIYKRKDTCGEIQYLHRKRKSVLFLPIYKMPYYTHFILRKKLIIEIHYT